MNKEKLTSKIIIIFLLGLIIFYSTGCQLAKPEGNLTQKKDQLIGVYITFEHLDLYDFERFLKENTNKIISNNNLTISPEYQDRIYATPSENKSVKFEFEGIEGVLFANYTYEDENGNMCSSVGNSGEISNVIISVTDTGRNIEGTMTVRNTSNINVYMNPVYQTEDDKVYLLSGSGLSFSGNSGTASQVISESYKVTEGNSIVEETFSVKMNYKPEEQIEMYVLKQLDNDDVVIGVTEFTPDNSPSQIIRLKNTSYMILEQYVKSNNNEDIKTRKLINNEEDFNVYYFSNKNVAKLLNISIKQ